eukprot:7361695-Ditylum_brightwellii.AAC.1
MKGNKKQDDDKAQRMKKKLRRYPLPRWKGGVIVVARRATGCLNAPRRAQSHKMNGRLTKHSLRNNNNKKMQQHLHHLQNCKLCRKKKRGV